MPTSADSDRRTDRQRDRATTTLPAWPTREDLLLALVPLAFLVGIVVSHLSALPARTGLAGASLVGVVVLVEALFRNPPLSE